MSTATAGPAGRLGALWHAPGVRPALLLVTAGRLILGLVGWLGAVPPQSPAGPRALQALTAAPGSLAAALEGPWQRDDALWYQWIATGGYGEHPAQAAFFPLYPVTVRAAGAVVGDITAAGLAVSTLAAAAALVLLHRLVRLDLGEAVARRAVLLLACFPFAFFLLAPFTESLFLALALGSLLSARRGRLWWAGLLAALASTCRLQGAALFLPLAWEAAADARRCGRLRPRHLAAVMPLAALGLTAAYLGARSGLSGGFGTVEQRYWDVHLAAPWTVLDHSLGAIASGRHPEEAANLVTGLLALAALPVMWRRLPRAQTLLAAALILPLWFRENGYSPMMSTGRFCTVIFPLFVVAATLLGDRRVRQLATLSAATMLALFLNFTRYHFVG